MQLLESSQKRSSNDFQLPARSVMAGTRVQKPRENVPGQHIVVVDAKQGRMDAERRKALKRAAI